MVGDGKSQIAGQSFTLPHLKELLRLGNSAFLFALVGLQRLDAAGANVRTLLVLGMTDSGIGAVCPILRGVPHLDGAAHSIVDPLNVFAVAAFRVMADKNRLAEGDAVRNSGNCFLRSVCILGAALAVVGESFAALLGTVYKVCTLVVWRLDRLGRNLADLVGLIAELEQRKINFESLTEKIETSSPAGRLVFHVFAALAEFERNLIRERTVAGLKAARARGRAGGRPSKLSAKEIKTIRALLKSADIPVSEIAARFHIARSTLYRVLKPAA